MDEDDCFTCGARPRHQRMVERRCPQCNDIFRVKSDKNKKIYCTRECYLENYNQKRRR